MPLICALELAPCPIFPILPPGVALLHVCLQIFTAVVGAICCVKKEDMNSTFSELFHHKVWRNWHVSAQDCEFDFL